VRKEQRLRKRRAFTGVYEGGRSCANLLSVLYYLANRMDITRVGFSVSRRLGKAVVRNRVRRRYREAYRALRDRVLPGYDIVFIARRPAADAQYVEIEASIEQLLRKAGLLREGR